jgi:DHA2 family metal-tetracycline-proton antiporter-like MFS transporter
MKMAGANPDETSLVQRKIPLPLCFIIFFSVLNGTMFQVAVPDIASTFRILPSTVSWVMTAYIVVFALGTLIYGKLADSYPDKDLITIGLLLMSLGSLVGLFSRWYPVVLAARVMQAGGGASIPALAMLIVTRYFQSNRRGRMFGLIASTVALAAAAGPVLGGFISGILHWKYMFLTSLPTIGAIPIFRKYLPGRITVKGNFDFMGAVLIGCAVVFVLLFVTGGSMLFLTAGIVSAVWFLFHVLHEDMPFVNPDLFRSSAYRNTILGSFLSVGTVFGMMFAVPIMLRDLNGLSTDRIGLIMLPGAMSAALAGSIGGRISDRKGSKFVVHMGTVFLTGGFFLLSTFSGSGPWIITVNLIICYIGFAFLQSSLPHTLSDILPAGETGVGMGLYNLVFFISGAFSTAVIGRTLDLKPDWFCLNPFTDCAVGGIYTNIFMMLAAAVISAEFIFIRTFRRWNKGKTERSCG